jgi:ABC-type branched-subunit amino acid transport system ATPase component/ABC-type branched-subunit amino acid transport system permease subunit
MSADLAVAIWIFDVTPVRILLGVFSGLVYGLLAVGLVLVYRASRFINFAHGAIGVFGAAVVGVLAGRIGIPYWIAFVIGLASAGLVAAMTEAGLIRRLSDSPRIIGMVVTLGLATFLSVLALIINQDNATGASFPLPAGLPSDVIIDGFAVSEAYLAMVLLTPFLFVALALFLKRSRFGLALRASADNRDAALLAGVSAPRMVTLAWVIAGVIAAFSATLVWPTQGLQGVDSLGPALLIKGLAAAAIARFTSLTIAFVASIAIGIFEQVLLSAGINGLFDIALFVVIAVALLLQPRLARRDEDRGDWARLAPPPLPTAYLKLRSIRALDVIGAALFFVVAVGLTLVPWLNAERASLLAAVVGFAIVGLSVGIVTGLAGQLSLGQFAFAGIGGAVSVQVTDLAGNFWVGLAAGCLAAGLVSVLVGIPALRLRGLALAVVTLAFALATTQFLLRLPFLIGNGLEPAQPVAGDLSFGVPKNYYLLSLALLAVAMWLARNMRKRGPGRVLIALRDNEDAARALTVSASRRKLQTYGVAGAMAGLGGIVTAHGLTAVDTAAFPVVNSINVVTSSVVGGLGTLFGPVLGALYVKGLPSVLGIGIILAAVVTLSWLVLIVLAPSGFGGILYGLRRRIADLFARVSGIDPAEAEAADAALSDGERVIRTPDLEHLRERATRTPIAVPSDADLILTVRGLSKSYGGVQAVRDVDLSVRRGEILGIIGPNGAGKTTMFEMVAGFVTPDAGEVRFNGRDITSLSPEARARLGLVRSFQSARLFPTMTVLDTVAVAQEGSQPVRMVPAMLGLGRSEKARYARAHDMVDLLGLGPLARRPVGELSTGTRRMVELAASLALDPEVLLLDEPAGGIAQSEGDVLVELFNAVRSELGTTLVVIEHDLPLLFRLADRLVAMELGAVIAQGSPDEVRNHPDVVRSYLGGEIAAVERSGSALFSHPANQDAAAAAAAAPEVPAGV